MSDPMSRLPTLIAALKDQHVSVVWNAARELAKLDSQAASALPALAEALQSRDATSALWARFAIAVITGEPEKHLPVLIEALSDKRIFPGMAPAALAGLGRTAAPAIPALLPKLRDEKPDNRWSAAWALTNIAKDARESGVPIPALREAVPALAAALTDDPDEKVRWYAACALSEIGPDALPVLPALIAALNDPDEDARGYAVRAVGRIGPPAFAALLPLVRLRDDPTENENIRAEAETALREIQSGP